MKIRVRLSLLFILCSTASLLVCGFLLLRTSARSTIQAAEDNAVSELTMLKTSFSSAAAKNLDAGASDTVRRSLLIYTFQSYADDTFSGSQYVLKRGEETLYNNSGYAPEALLGGLERNTVTWQGEKLFAAGTDMDLLRETYQLYLIRNVTDLYDSVARLRLQFGIICIVAVLLSAALILLVTSRTLRPLKTLEREAAAMGQGDYRARIPLSDRARQRRDEITTVSESFNRMADAVEQHIDSVTALAEERKMLIGALTHEMKTPLTAIIGYAESLDRAKLNAEQLITLTDGADIAIRDVSARELFDTAKQTLQIVADRQGASLSFVENGERFAMDVDLITGVLINLVDNACSAGAKHVTVSARERVISVSDDGCGIPPKIVEKVTQPFFRADKARSRRGGHAGLGLALAERVAQLHGARLLIESREGSGTTVSLCFGS